MYIYSQSNLEFRLKFN